MAASLSAVAWRQGSGSYGRADAARGRGSVSTSSANDVSVAAAIAIAVALRLILLARRSGRGLAACMVRGTWRSSTAAHAQGATGGRRSARGARLCGPAQQAFISGTRRRLRPDPPWPIDVRFQSSARGQGDAGSVGDVQRSLGGDGWPSQSATRTGAVAATGRRASVEVGWIRSAMLPEPSAIGASTQTASDRGRWNGAMPVAGPDARPQALSPTSGPAQFGFGAVSEYLSAGDAPQLGAHALASPGRGLSGVHGGTVPGPGGGSAWRVPRCTRPGAI